MNKSLPELYELLEPILREEKEFRPYCDELVEKMEQAIAKKIGIPAHCGFRSDYEAREYLAERKRLEKETGAGKALKKLEDIRARMDPILGAIVERHAVNLEDLCIKAKAAAIIYGELWRDRPDQLDWHERVLRNLIEEILALGSSGLPKIKLDSSRTNLH